MNRPYASGSVLYPRWFIVWFSAAFLLGFIALFFVVKGDVVLWLNQRHTPMLDTFFRYVTWLGDGWMFLFVAIVLACIRYYDVIMLLAIVLLQTLLVQIGKRWLFEDRLRPKYYLQELGYDALHLVDGVTVHAYYSFPSGHTATAFSLAAFAALLSKNRYLSVLFFLVACLVGISRMYLMQHFYIDVYAGALIGVVSSCLVWSWFENKKWASDPGLNRSLLK